MRRNSTSGMPRRKEALACVTYFGTSLFMASSCGGTTTKSASSTAGIVLLQISALDALSIYMDLLQHEFGPPPCQRSSVVGVFEVGALITEAARSSPCNIAVCQTISIR